MSARPARTSLSGRKPGVGGLNAEREPPFGERAVAARRAGASREDKEIDWRDLLGRAVLAGLFLVLAARIGADVARTYRITGLLLLLSESLVVLLTVVRRPANAVDRRLATRAVMVVSILGPPLVDPAAPDVLRSSALATTASALGLLVIIGGKLSLGRSFGFVPANRGLIDTGLYRLVRHPIYAGYFLAHAGFLLEHWSSWNFVVLVGADAALLARLAYEERILGRDPRYLRYCERVRWRLIPGAF